MGLRTFGRSSFGRDLAAQRKVRYERSWWNALVVTTTDFHLQATAMLRGLGRLSRFLLAGDHAGERYRCCPMMAVLYRAFSRVDLDCSSSSHLRRPVH